MKTNGLIAYFDTHIKPLVDDLDHKHDNCLVCTDIEAAIKHPTLDDHLKALDELEHTAPYGRCSQCNLALTETEMHLYGDMHQSCAETHYE